MTARCRRFAFTSLSSNESGLQSSMQGNRAEPPGQRGTQLLPTARPRRAGGAGAGAARHAGQRRSKGCSPHPPTCGRRAPSAGRAGPGTRPGTGTLHTWQRHPKHGFTHTACTAGAPGGARGSAWRRPASTCRPCPHAAGRAARARRAPVPPPLGCLRRLMSEASRYRLRSVAACCTDDEGLGTLCCVSILACPGG